MLTGVIQTFFPQTIDENGDKRKFFGFVRDDKSDDTIFFNGKSVDLPDQIAVGTLVKFRTRRDSLGRQEAVDIKILGAADAQLTTSHGSVPR